MLPKEVVLETANFLQYYFDTIRKGLEQGVIKPHPSELIGGFLYQDIVAVMELIKSESDPARKEAVIRAGFEIFWDGIKAGPPA
jgi:hypothetical protein